MGLIALSIRELQCSAGARVLFEGLDIELRGGEGLLLVGPNGSGKTTLLRAIAGLARPTQGSIRWQVEPQADAGSDASGPVTGAICLFSGHASAWKSELTALENLRLQCALDGSAVSREQLADALERAGILAQADLRFGRLSAGQRRRLTLARLMLDGRSAWLLDEPATALDDAGLRVLAGLIDAKLSAGGIVVAATHQDMGVRSPMRRLNLAELRTPA